MVLSKPRWAAAPDMLNVIIYGATMKLKWRNIHVNPKKSLGNLREKQLKNANGGGIYQFLNVRVNVMSIANAPLNSL